MEIPREKMILVMYGHFLCRSKSFRDLVIEIDNFLIARNYPPLTKDEKENLFEKVYDEFWVLMKCDGLNRKDFRSMQKH